MFWNSQVKNIYYDNRVRLSLHFHLASLKKVLVVKIKTPEITKHWGRQGTARTLRTSGGNVNWHNPIENNLASPSKAEYV